MPVIGNKNILLRYRNAASMTKIVSSVRILQHHLTCHFTGDQIHCKQHAVNVAIAAVPRNNHPILFRQVAQTLLDKPLIQSRHKQRKITQGIEGIIFQMHVCTVRYRFLRIDKAFANEINFADFYEGMTSMMNNDGHQTALPFGQSGQIFYYNKTLLNELGLTLPTKTEEMGSFLETVYNATGKPVIDVHGTDNAYFYCLFTNMGAFMIDTETNTTGLESDVALNLIKKLREWVDKGYITWVINDVGNTLLLDFTSGACASALYTSSVYASYKDKAESGANGVTFEVGIANQPYGDYGTNHQYVAGATLIIPSAECNTQAQKNAAFKLASFLTAPAQQLDWATTSSYYVTRKSAATDPAYADAYNALLEKLPETSVIDLNSYVTKTKHPLFDKCGDIFENYMSEIMTNGMDPEEGWELMVEEINDTLADQ